MMTNQEAIEVMFNEWKCIDRNDGVHCDRKCESCDLVMDVQIIREAFNKAISALEAQEAKNSKESSSTHIALDTISRQAAIDAVETKIKKWNAVDGEGYHVGLGLRYTDVIDTLTELPSAQPEIIHCRDCRYSIDFYQDGCCYCKRPSKEMRYIEEGYGFYCAGAERRTDDLQ